VVILWLLFPWGGHFGFWGGHFVVIFLSYGHIWFWEWSLYGNFVVIFSLVWSRMWLFYGYFVVIRVVTLWLRVLLCVGVVTVWLLYGYFFLL